MKLINNSLNLKYNDYKAINSKKNSTSQPAQPVNAQPIREPQSKEVSFQGGFHNAVKKFAGTKLVLDVGQMAGSRAGMFEATFAILITCILRPLTIVATPDKSDKRDKQYAAAQSISSGMVGLLTAKLMLDPFSNAGENLGHKINVNRINQLHSQEDGHVFKELCKKLGIEDKTFGEGITTLNKYIEDSTKELESNLIDLKKYKLAIIDTKSIKNDASLKEQVDSANQLIKHIPMDNQTVDAKIKSVEKNIKIVVNNILGISDQKADLGIKPGKGNSKLIVNLEELDIAKAIKALALEYQGDKKSKFKFIKEVEDANFVDVLKGIKINDNIKYLMKNKYYEPFKFLGWSYGTKFLITPILAILTIGAVTPIVKKLFPKKSEIDSKKEPNGKDIKPVSVQQSDSKATSKPQELLKKGAVN